MISFESIKSIDILDDTPLGEGAFSFVYKVRHRDNGQIYAMKKIDILNLSKADCENLKLEIQLHQDLLHENIIKFHGCIQRKNLVYMLLENAANGSLFFYIDIKEGLPELLALRFFYETARGIQYLHDLNIVHRDIKPENILLDKDFRIKVCDFGWSCKIEGDDVRSSICGTYEYMSPEIVNEKSHDYGVDIWCLGILLFEMLHGNPPFTAENLKDIKKEFQKKKITVDPKYDPDTIDLIDQLLQYDPADRISIEEALNHRAIKKNLKQIQRKITQEEYNLLTRYYYMNSGGNQLMTHNSTYARQLKRQSMLTKSSHNSLKSQERDPFRTRDSDFFDTRDDLFDSNKKSDPLKMLHRPEELRNNFVPDSFKHNKVHQGMGLANQIGSSAFRKKVETNEVREEVLPSNNYDTRVSEREFQMFKNKEDKMRQVNAGVMEEVSEHKRVEKYSDHVEKSQGKKEHVVKNKQGVEIGAKRVEVKEIDKVSANLSKANRVQANTIEHNRSKPQKQGGASRLKAASKQQDKVKKVKKSDPLRIANDNLIKRAKSKKNLNEKSIKNPKNLNNQNHTTLEEFRKKYNPEKFKQKFQEPETKKNPVQQTTTNINRSKPVTSNLRNQVNTQRPQIQRQEIQSARTPIRKVDPIDRLMNQKKMNKANGQTERTISKSPSTGHFTMNKKKFTNLRDAVKNKAGSKQINTQRQKQEAPSKNERKRAVTNITSISQNPASIFQDLQKKGADANFSKTQSNFKSTNLAETSKPSSSIIKNYKSDINKATTTTTTNIRKHLIRTEVQKVRATGALTTRFPAPEQEKEDANSKPKSGYGGNLTKTPSRGNLFSRTQYITQTFDDRDSEHPDKRYSLGVRSRTVELKDSGSSRHNLNNLIQIDSKNQQEKKLSKIFEEASPMKTQEKAKSKPSSLFQHLKKNKFERFINLKDVDRELSVKKEANLRSKSTDPRAKNNSNGVRGKFNKRIVYVNGKKTEKFIYSKGKNGNPEQPAFVQPEDTKPETDQKQKDDKNEKKQKNPETTSANEIKKKANEPKSEESDPKKKYKIVTVPQVKARVHTEGGLKFSNIKPITVIQQGTFAIAQTTRSRESERKNTSNTLDQPATSRKAQTPNNPKSVEKNQRKATEDLSAKGNSKREPSANTKRIISYQEYQRRIQKTIEENERQKTSPIPVQKSLKTITTTAGQTTRAKNQQISGNLATKNNERPFSVELVNRNAQGHTTQVISNNITLAGNTPQTKTVTMTPTLAKNLYKSKENMQNISGKNGSDNINTLVRKLEKINQTTTPTTHSKTNTAISLNTLLKQVNDELKPKPSEPSRFVNHTQITPQGTKVHQKYLPSIGHKKNKTMYNINQQVGPAKPGEYPRVKSGSSFNNYIPAKEVSPQKTREERDVDFFRGNQSKSSNRNYNSRPDNTVPERNQKKPGVILSRPHSSRAQHSTNMTIINNTTNNVKIYTNMVQPGMFMNNSNPRRQMVGETERFSQRRADWRNVIKTTGNMKQSNSVKKFSNQERTTSLTREVNAHKTGKVYTYQVGNGARPVHMGNANPLQTGNVTTTIRRYTVNPSPVKGDVKDRFKSPGNPQGLVGTQKKQIFADLKTMNQNLKTVYYKN